MKGNHDIETVAPVSAELLVPGNAGAPVIPWPEARIRLAEAFTYWLATVHPDGRPQLRPVLAVWADGALHTTTSPGARKARNLAGDLRCCLATHGDGLDLVVVEGTVATVTPVVVFGFGTGENRYGPRSTRWQFARAS
jgi:Pyridoxamine 5'-phosphate oxidase